MILIISKEMWLSNGWHDIVRIEPQVLGLRIQDKDIGHDFNYYSLPLPKHIQHYAAVDVILTCLLVEKCWLLLQTVILLYVELPMIYEWAQS